LSAIFFLTLLLYLIYDVHELWWARKSLGQLEQKQATPVIAWVRKNVKPDEITASRNPLAFFLYTQRPAILVPEKAPSK